MPEDLARRRWLSRERGEVGARVGTLRRHDSDGHASAESAKGAENKFR